MKTAVEERKKVKSRVTRLKTESVELGCNAQEASGVWGEGQNQCGKTCLRLESNILEAHRLTVYNG